MIGPALLRRARRIVSAHASRHGMSFVPVIFAAIILSATAGRAQSTPSAPDRGATATEGAAQNKHVWTNADLPRLRDQADVSVVGPRPNMTLDNAPSSGPFAENGVEAGANKETDPAWYREQLAPVEAELDALDEQINALLPYRSITNYMVGGVVISQLAGLPLNPEDQIRQLQTRREDVMQDIEQLHDIARRHDIRPGDIR